MALCDLYNIKGEKIGEIEIKDEVFNVEIKPYLIHEVVRMQLASKRRGTASTKTRGEVSGSGRKLYRQKGTGRSRQGSITSPLHVGGGKVFGPHPRSYAYKIPKKARRYALKSALSATFKEANMKVIDKIELEKISTKSFYNIIKTFNLTKPLFVIDKKDEKIEKSARNIPYVKVLRVEGLNVYDVIRHEQLIFTLDALRKTEEVLA
ncbi:MAG: 50S ribosomal protein L4 [Desulfobacterota bacterium]|nr:50S ribosomal protein L4 [Thermodesulfobacteriota bacterium]MDW8002375.1 50S ribosomal protein L4 [Deltaproteobacteria bacterium]